MTREEFIKALERDYFYKIKGDKIVVTHWGNVDLRSLTSLPPDVKFENGGYVDLSSLTSLPPGVQFNNRGSVRLNSLKTLPPGVEFKNEVGVNLESLIGGWFSGGWDGWKGNIKGIKPNRLLNKMIELGLFDKGR